MEPIQELETRKLPDLLRFNDGSKVVSKKDWEKRKEEIEKILCEDEYGFFPKEYLKIATNNIKSELDYCGGKATFNKEELTLYNNNFKFKFPINVAIPNDDKNHPVFVYIDFYNEFPNKNLPVEEILDNGFAIVSFCYKDITSDDNNFQDKLCKYFQSKEEKNSFGKIMVWSFAAMHVIDYVSKLAKIDSNNIAIVGHSRLGKTALLTGAFDEKIKYTISNDSGQSGASISRKKKGETIKDICTRFSYWFCDNYKKYMDNEANQPFDQHYLTSLIAPRYLYISSASKDYWADPTSEFLCCIATDEVYKLLGKKGFIYENKYPLPGEKLHQGNIGYHLREGTHYLSRYDWNKFMEYIKSKI